MQNLHDDNHLDNLSRKAAEQFELDGDLHSWEQLKPKLDTALPEKKERKRRFLIIFLMFLLVGGGLVIYGIVNNQRPTATVDNAGKAQDQNTDKTNQSGDQTGSKEQSKEQTNKSGDNISNNTTVTDKAVTQETTTASETAKADNTSQGVVNKQSTLQNSSSRPQTNTNPIGNNTSRRNAIRNNTVVRENQLPRNNGTVIPGDESKNAITSQNKSDKPVKNSAKANTTAIADASNRVDKTITEDKLQERSEPTLDSKVNSIDVQSKINKPDVYPWSTQTAQSPSVVAKNSKQPRNRWEFGLTYAPDISTVKFTHTQPPGQNFGITIGYNFTQRLSLQTAIIYTTKNYKMYGSDYHPPKGYWTSYYKIETVTGECSMWDIPLNLRYNIAPRKKSNFFVSSGLSSYLMQEEDYEFFYHYNSNPTTRYRSMDTARRYIASILNISAGYERQIGKTFSLQVEPFFKQPLTGIGFGNMKLNSTGIYFTVKYKPLSRRASP